MRGAILIGIAVMSAAACCPAAAFAQDAPHNDLGDRILQAFQSWRKASSREVFPARQQRLSGLLQKTLSSQTLQPPLATRGPAAPSTPAPAIRSSTRSSRAY